MSITIDAFWRSGLWLKKKEEQEEEQEKVWNFDLKFSRHKSLFAFLLQIIYHLTEQINATSLKQEENIVQQKKALENFFQETWTVKYYIWCLLQRTIRMLVKLWEDSLTWNDCQTTGLRYFCENMIYYVFYWLWNCILATVLLMISYLVAILLKLGSL